ncbi:hypothetical protein I4U23_027550 [Adineta vaga]|nr:hypothetical protein I4U23_027550 [Adineta vaga]
MAWGSKYETNTNFQDKVRNLFLISCKLHLNMESIIKFIFIGSDFMMVVNDRNKANYQRLEFLGDSVLSLVVSEHLYRTYPHYEPGHLTDNRRKLAESRKQLEIAKKIKIEQHIDFAQGVERKLFLRYDNFVESLIGAIYIDGGLEAARRVIHHLWDFSVDITDDAKNTWSCVIS